MFGFQRVGDLAWAAGDSRARGFLLGATAGRTTLNGEGLQHEDGHSHILASTIPNCVSYDPTFHYELAVIIQDGLRRMVQEQQDVFYYLTVMNEKLHPSRHAQGRRGRHHQGPVPAFEIQGQGPQGAAHGQRRHPARSHCRRRAAGAGLGRIRRRMERHQLQRTAPRRPGCAPLEHAASGRKTKESYVEKCLKKAEGPVIASTDYMKAFADQIRAFVPQRYVVLGTDGFGRSDSREALRRHFEVDRHYVVLAALKALADEGKLPASKAAEAIRKYGIDVNKPNPLTA